MWQIDWGKLVLLALVVAVLTFLCAIGRVSETSLIGLIGLVVGYLTGNGKAATRGHDPQPVIRRLPTLPEEDRRSS